MGSSSTPVAGLPKSTKRESPWDGDRNLDVDATPARVPLQGC